MIILGNKAVKAAQPRVIRLKRGGGGQAPGGGKSEEFGKAENALSIKKSESNISKKLNRDRAFLTEADPVREVLGPGKVSHPEEWRNTIKTLQKEGVEITITNEEKLAYAPGLRAGEPGQIHLNKDASIGALRHEYQHFLDDKAAGYKGMRGLYDFEFRKQTEINAYNKEIQLMEEMGQEKAVHQLKVNLAEEIKRLERDLGGFDIEF